MISSYSDTFKRAFYPEIGKEWHHWHWQMQHALKCRSDFEKIMDLSEEERVGLDQAYAHFPVLVTPYYTSLICNTPPGKGLRKTMLPIKTFNITEDHEESDDPLGERAHNPVRAIVHTYPDKVLFLLTNQCASYCRYCTRSRILGQKNEIITRSDWQDALEYIRQHSEIRDVLISGGDPLILDDALLDHLLSEIRAIPHVEIIRLGSKIPAVLPQRITPELISMLKKQHPLWMSLHFTHPDELTPEATHACAMLADAGIPLCSQTVLLKDVNDDASTMKLLMQGLLKMRVKPYYLHHCDAVTGAALFRVPISRGQEIIKALHGYTTGYAVPMYMLDAPGGGGKVPIGPDYVVNEDDHSLEVVNYRGETYRVEKK